MRKTTGLIAGIGMLGATLMPVAAAADAKIYAYPTGANYCPAGLQPVTIGGVICCGAPNQHITYQQMMAHPVQKRHVTHPQIPRPARFDCPVGVKGC